MLPAHTGNLTPICDLNSCFWNVSKVEELSKITLVSNLLETLPYTFQKLKALTH